MLSSIKQSVNLSWQRSREANALPFHSQLLEMLALSWLTRLGPGNYHKYRLWQKGIPWQEKKRYWHDQKYYKFLNQANPLSHRMLARNKIIAKALLKFYDIPDAAYIGHLSSKGGLGAGGRTIEGSTDFAKLLADNLRLNRICFKPVEGSGGEGFCAAVIDRNDGVRLINMRDGAVHTVEAFIQTELGALRNSDYIVEEYVDQHPVLAAFNPTSLNTIRVWIGQNGNGKIRVLGMFLRVGRTGSLVDNKVSGGFAVAIDLDTFSTIAAFPHDGRGQTFCNHPDSNFDMTAQQLPFGPEVIALSNNVLKALPSTRFVGLDVAISEAGPLIIEFNLAPTAIGAAAIRQSHGALLEWILE